MRTLVVCTGLSILFLLICDAFATNAKIVTPPGIKFTVKLGGDSTIMIDSPDCTGWEFSQGPLGNVRLTCIQK